MLVTGSQDELGLTGTRFQGARYSFPQIWRTSVVPLQSQRWAFTVLISRELFVRLVAVGDEVVLGPCSRKSDASGFGECGVVAAIALSRQG